MKSLINKMKNTDTWYKDDLSRILANYNPHVGDIHFFSNAICQAQEAKIFEPTSFPTIKNSGFFSNATILFEYNFQYLPIIIVKWIDSKGWKFPKKLLSLGKEVPVSSALEDLLNKSPTWMKMKDFLKENTSEYPKWKECQTHAVKKNDILQWAKKFTKNNREADFIKTILSEIFK